MENCFCIWSQVQWIQGDFINGTPFVIRTGGFWLVWQESSYSMISYATVGCYKQGMEVGSSHLLFKKLISQWKQCKARSCAAFQAVQVSSPFGLPSLPDFQVSKSSRLLRRWWVSTALLWTIDVSSLHIIWVVWHLLVLLTQGCAIRR